MLCHWCRTGLAVLWLTLACLTLPPAYGHEPVDAPGCSAPRRPVDDQDDVLWQRFLDQVDGFRACISTYAEVNHRASATHRDAANRATVAWNRFVRTELNVPADYPWPPGERDPARPPKGR